MKFEQYNSSVGGAFSVQSYPQIPLTDGGIVKPVMLFTGEDRCMILQRETGRTLFLPRQAQRQFASGVIREDVQKRIRERGFSMESCQEERNVPVRKPLPTFFLIDLTSNCNFNCTYCFRRHDLPKDTISDDRLEAICSYLLAYCRRYKVGSIVIQPWGGEPLLQAEKILKIRRFFSSVSNPQVRIVLETNGALITESLARELLRNGVELSVSFDGLPELHDLQRIDQHGQPTAAQVIRGISLARQAGYRNIGSVCVLTRRGIGQIREILEYCDNVLHLTNIRINPVHRTTNEDSAFQPMDAADISQMARELAEAQWSRFQRGSRLFEANTTERVRNLLGNSTRSICRSRGCCGGNGLIAFSMDGGIFPCDLTDFEDMKLGSVDDQQDLCELIGAAQKHHAYFGRKEKSECAECPWWFFCRGGCTASLRYEGRMGVGVDERECIINQQMYPRILSMLLSAPRR